MDFFKGNNKDVTSAAMDFFKGDDKKDDNKDTATTTTTASTASLGGELQKKSSGELLASAKLVAEAAQSALHNESDKLDKAKVAGAAADLLDAAKGYGKLGDAGVGKYVEQAEDYLEKYSHTNATTTTATPPATTGAEDKKPEEKVEAESDHEKSGGDYLKMAQGFLGKH